MAFFVTSSVNAQQLLFNASSPVRDFAILGDTLVYSSSSNINVLVNKEVVLSYFGGGHVLKLDFTNDSEIISLANKYKEFTGSIRKFSIEKKSLTKVIDFDIPSALLDYTFFPEEFERMMVSFNNGLVNIYDVSKPNSLKIDLGNFGLVRDIKVKGKEIYFCTDFGEMYKYANDTLIKLFYINPNQKLLGFSFFNNKIVAFTNLGNLIIYNIENFNYIIYPVVDVIITDMIVIKNRYAILGDWQGNISTFDLIENQLINKFKAHDSSVLRLKILLNYDYISSGADGKIIGWE